MSIDKEYQKQNKTGLVIVSMQGATIFF